MQLQQQQQQQPQRGQPPPGSQGVAPVTVKPASMRPAPKASSAGIVFLVLCLVLAVVGITFYVVRTT